MEPRRVRLGDEMHVVDFCDESWVPQWSPGEFAWETAPYNVETMFEFIPQWSPGGSPGRPVANAFLEPNVIIPQWSPGESTTWEALIPGILELRWYDPQWSPGEFAWET